MQDHEGPGIKTGQLGVHIGDGDNRLIVYDSTPDRSGAGPERVFQCFGGYLQADADSVFLGDFLPREIGASTERLRAARAVVKALGAWLAAKGHAIRNQPIWETGEHERAPPAGDPGLPGLLPGLTRRSEPR